MVGDEPAGADHHPFAPSEASSAGGHNVAGTSLTECGLTIDMSRMGDVTVDPVGKLVRVGAGCLLKDVDQATQEHGLATVFGLVSDTGLAGLPLGGGFGYLTRRSAGRSTTFKRSRS